MRFSWRALRSSSGASKSELQRELHDPRIAGGLNLAEARAVECGDQWCGRRPRRDAAEVDVVDHIEDLPAELHRLGTGDLERSREREVVLEIARIDDRERRQRAVGTGGRRSECRAI